MIVKNLIAKKCRENDKVRREFAD